MSYKYNYCGSDKKLWYWVTEPPLASRKPRVYCKLVKTGGKIQCGLAIPLRDLRGANSIIKHNNG